MKENISISILVCSKLRRKELSHAVHSLGTTPSRSRTLTSLVEAGAVEVKIFGVEIENFRLCSALVKIYSAVGHRL
jgi:hypothetical protein